MSLLAACLGAVGLVAIACSLLVGIVSLALRTQLARLAPAAQARVHMAAALLPAAAAVLVLGAALAPSFGWLKDHCHGSHSHPHLCVAHEIAEQPSLPLLLLAALVAIRLGQTVFRTGLALARSRRTLHDMRQASEDDGSGLRVLPTSTPQAFVVGLLSPQVYATRGLTSGGAKAHLPAVLAHEDAHRRRRDPLRKFLIRVGLHAHLPFLARRLEAAHARAVEMAADHDAATSLGNPAQVASALVALAKARVRVPEFACGATNGHSVAEVEERVVHLMSSRRRWDWPKTSAIALLASSAAIAVALAAESVHHKVEYVLAAFWS